MSNISVKKSFKKEQKNFLQKQKFPVTKQAQFLSLIKNLSFGFFLNFSFVSSPRRSWMLHSHTNTHNTFKVQVFLDIRRLSNNF